MNLTRLWFFYILLFLPIAGLIFLSKFHFINNVAFVCGLFSFVFIYQPMISGIRLVQTKKIPREDFFKNFIPRWNDRFFNFIFFNVEPSHWSPVFRRKDNKKKVTPSLILCASYCLIFFAANLNSLIWHSKLLVHCCFHLLFFLLRHFFLFIASYQKHKWNADQEH